MYRNNKGGDYGRKKNTFTRNDKKEVDFIIENYAGVENVGITIFHSLIILKKK